MISHRTFEPSLPHRAHIAPQACLYIRTYVPRCVWLCSLNGNDRDGWDGFETAQFSNFVIHSPLTITNSPYSMRHTTLSRRPTSVSAISILHCLLPSI